MAEISEQRKTAQKKAGVRRGKKMSTRVDLTPMVDLGFLLITFFIFTSAIAKPTAIKLTMPDDRNVIDSSEVSEDRTLTLLVSKSDELFYYEGRFGGTVSKTDYKSVRDVVMQKKLLLRKKFASGQLVVLIKVANEASYKNVVDCLDEMIINDVSTYMLLEPTPQERHAMAGDS